MIIVPDDGLQNAWPDAQYHEETNPEYAGNSLIMTLPELPLEVELFEKFARLPARRGDAHRHASLPYRIDALGAIQNTYVPFRRDYDAFYQIFNAMRSCYASRNPANPEVMRAIMRALAGQYDTIERQSTSGGGANGLVLIGSTGMGKTSMLDRFVNFMGPQVVFHRELGGRRCRWPQIKYIRVQASPTEGSLTWLAESVAARIDALLGTRFNARFGARVGLTKYILQITKACSCHLLGMLIVDDVQNISEVSKHKELFLKTLSTFMEITGIPVLLVSTYKAAPVILDDLMYASKLTARGTTEFPAFELGEDWNTFLEALWESHPFPMDVPMPGDFPRIMHWHSQGILRIARELVVALFNYMAREEVYVPTMELLDAISADKFKHYQAHLSTLRSWRQDIKLTKAEYALSSDLIPPASGLKRLQDDIDLRSKRGAQAKLPENDDVADPKKVKSPKAAGTRKAATKGTAAARGVQATKGAEFPKDELAVTVRAQKGEDSYEVLCKEGWVLRDIMELE
jgi:hypothetical protein